MYRAYLRRVAEVFQHVAARDALPEILRYARLWSEGGKLWFEVSDHETWIQYRALYGETVPATCFEVYSLAQATKPVQDSPTPEGVAELAFLDGAMYVFWRGTRVRLPRMSPSGYPPASYREERDWGAPFTVDPAALHTALEYTLRARCRSASERPRLMAGQVDGGRLVVTDGHRVHRAAVDGWDYGRPVLLPYPALLALRSLTTDEGRHAESGDLIETAVGARWVRFSCGRWEVHTRIVDVQFPEMESLFQRVRSAKATDGTAQLRLACELLAERCAVAEVRVAGEHATIETLRGGVSTEVIRGEGLAQIPVQVQGEALVHLSLKYLHDALLSPGATCRLEFGGADDPVFVDTIGYDALVMPIRQMGA